MENDFSLFRNIPYHIRLFLISEIRKYSSLALLLHSENFKRGWHGWFYPLMPSSIYINLILGHVHSPTSANRIVVRWYYLMHNCDTVFEQLNSLEMILNQSLLNESLQRVTATRENAVVWMRILGYLSYPPCIGHVMWYCWLVLSSLR